MTHRTVFEATTANRRQFIGGLANLGIAGGVFVRDAHSSSVPKSGHHLLGAHALQTSGSQMLTDLLTYVPGRFIDEGTSLDTPWTYADIAQQLASLGISQEFDDSEDISRAATPLLLDANMYDFRYDEELIDAVGFNPLQVHSTLKVGIDLPLHLTLFRGGIDLDQLPSVWNASGYIEETAADGSTIWTIGMNGENDFTSHPIQSRVNAELNNVTMLDEVLVYASHFALLEESIIAYSDGRDLAVDNPDFDLLIASLPHNTVSAVTAVPANWPPLQFPPDWGPDVRTDYLESLEESDRTVGLAPNATGIIFGVTAGLSQPLLRADPNTTPAPTPDIVEGEGLCFIRIATASAADAEQMARVVEHRWNTWTLPPDGVSYADMMEIMWVSRTGSIAEIDFEAKAAGTLNVVASQDWLRLLLPIV